MFSFTKMGLYVLLYVSIAITFFIITFYTTNKAFHNSISFDLQNNCETMDIIMITFILQLKTLRFRESNKFVSKSLSQYKQHSQDQNPLLKISGFILLFFSTLLSGKISSFILSRFLIKAINFPQLSLKFHPTICMFLCQKDTSSSLHLQTCYQFP